MYRIILKDGETLTLIEKEQKKTAIAVKDDPDEPGVKICDRCICKSKRLEHLCCSFNCVASCAHLEWKEE